MSSQTQECIVFFTTAPHYREICYQYIYWHTKEEHFYCDSISLPGRNIPQLPPTVFYGVVGGRRVIFSVQNKLHSFSQSISKCFRLEVSYFTLFIPCDPFKYCMSSYQADLLRVILRLTLNILFGDLRRPQRQRGLCKSKQIPSCCSSQSLLGQSLEKEREIGSTLYCVS